MHKEAYVLRNVMMACSEKIKYVNQAVLHLQELQTKQTYVYQCAKLELIY